MRYVETAGRAVAIATAVFAAACAPVTAPGPAAPTSARGLPPIPAVSGALDIRIVHPTASTPRPAVDSSLVYGSVGTGTATLTINGDPVTVEPNGAFLAYLPNPADGTFNLTARNGGRTVTASRSYRMQAPQAAAAAPAPALVEFDEPRIGVVTGGSDTLRTGSDVAIGRTSPTGSFRWFLPRDARVEATGQLGSMVRVRMDTATAWFPAQELRLEESGVPTARAPLGAAAIEPSAGWVDVLSAAGHAPFHVTTEESRLRLIVHRRGPAPAATTSTDPLVSGIEWSDPGVARADIRLNGPLWGYKAFYDPAGDLVIRVRRPPAIDASRPLVGLRVVVDPGHPPAGATGPTGLTEAEANLAISLRVAEMLRAKGADVVMTRATPSPLVSSTDQTAELRARTLMAVEADAHLYVSIHNNAFPEGVNPERADGTSTYYYHPFSATLARYLNEEIVSETRIRDLGHRSGNLAVVRPTWFPAALTESLFMPIPRQEAALRDAGFVERLAAAHVLGLERFLRSRAR